MGGYYSATRTQVRASQRPKQRSQVHKVQPSRSFRHPVVWTSGRLDGCQAVRRNGPKAAESPRAVHGSRLDPQQRAVSRAGKARRPNDQTSRRLNLQIQVVDQEPGGEGENHPRTATLLLRSGARTPALRQVARGVPAPHHNASEAVLRRGRAALRPALWTFRRSDVQTLSAGRWVGHFRADAPRGGQTKVAKCIAPVFARVPADPAGANV